MMSTQSAGTIGLLAGAGRVPQEITESLARRGYKVHVVALRGSAEDVASWPVASCDWVGIAEVGGMLASFARADCREIMIAGGVRRPDLLRVRPDIGFFTNLPSVLSLTRGGDDHLLRRVIRFFEHKGYIVRGLADLTPDLLADAGALNSLPSRPSDAQDALLGRDVLAAFGQLDMGQAAVVIGGSLYALEGAEGTDKLLERVASQRAAQTGSSAAVGGTLVKMAKPAQDVRVDLPTIGPKTIENCRRAGLTAIAVEAGRTVIAERAATLAAADAAGIRLHGILRQPVHALPVSSDTARPDTGLCQVTAVGRRHPRTGALRDGWIGISALVQLEPIAGASGVVVSREHVLALGINEDLLSFLGRAKNLKQWGDNRRRRRRSGVVVVPRFDNLDRQVVRAAAGAGLLGIHVAARQVDIELPRREALGNEADQHGIFLTSCV
ncbi:MAG TPA: UDP-2,3-diacylglucosamine diphosphatase LpxI [Hyphomicrobiaceae bacterium]|nr:UDP-2,3-diacylglucosamine diphosphatase LpxI [Hyphomicrobiaceae bacterium]